VTEAEWESETSSGRLIEQIRRSIKLTPKARGRKCRLAAIVMLRTFLADKEVPALAPILDTVERWCDDQASLADVNRTTAAAAAHFSVRSDPEEPSWFSILGSLESLDASVSLRGIASSTMLAWEHMTAQQTTNPTIPFVAVQCRVIREVFGNMNRPAGFSPEWRTDTAITLACQMYESREFSAMPILADALQDAGCNDDDILAHCRDPKQVHVRGCWVVDLVLGKA
jgi:hypothetical protein